MGALSLWHILIVLVLFFGIYLLPTWIAFSRQHHNRGAILALNLLLGWTFLGWVGALVWALTAVRPPQSISN
jgi:ABC-type transport system involved in cytochrome c biogenesis permease component